MQTFLLVALPLLSFLAGVLVTRWWLSGTRTLNTIMDEELGR